MKEIKLLLENYYNLKAEVKLMELKNIIHKDKCKLDFLEVCIDCLPPDYQKIIVGIYKDKQSASNIARELYQSRTTICRKRELAIGKISALFTAHFK